MGQGRGILQLESACGLVNALATKIWNKENEVCEKENSSVFGDSCLIGSDRHCHSSRGADNGATHQGFN